MRRRYTGGFIQDQRSKSAVEGGKKFGSLKNVDDPLVETAGNEFVRETTVLLRPGEKSKKGTTFVNRVEKKMGEKPRSDAIKELDLGT